MSGKKLHRKRNQWYTRDTQDAAQKAQGNAFADKVDKLVHKYVEMEQKSRELDKWRQNFNAEQKKHSRKQDKKITKQLDSQTQNIDSKITELANSAVSRPHHPALTPRPNLLTYT
eukprot:10121708-Ditylum_brightwellii.AAC.1